VIRVETYGFVGKKEYWQCLNVVLHMYDFANILKKGELKQDIVSETLSTTTALIANTELKNCGILLDSRTIRDIENSYKLSPEEQKYLGDKIEKELREYIEKAVEEMH